MKIRNLPHLLNDCADAWEYNRRLAGDRHALRYLSRRRNLAQPLRLRACQPDPIARMIKAIRHTIAAAYRLPVAMLGPAPIESTYHAYRMDEKITRYRMERWKG